MSKLPPFNPELDIQIERVLDQLIELMKNK